MDEGRKIQWHPAFCCAVRLELKESKKELSFENEHNLNSKPIQIDLLVIKKSEDVVINNEIGRFFKGHNVLEYKSPEDALGVDEYYKSLAYACLYKSAGSFADAIQAEDITISLVRSRKPERLFQFFKEKKYEITNPYKGIYYVKKEGLFDTQVIVSKELNYTEHIWIKSLQENLSQKEIRTLVSSIQELKEVEDKRNAEAVMNVVLEVNKKGFGKVKEEEAVASALRELMAPEIEKAVEEALQRAAQENKKTVQETEQKTEQKIQEQTAIVALENGLEDSLIRKHAPSISEERLRILKQQVAEKKNHQ